MMWVIDASIFGATKMLALLTLKSLHAEIEKKQQNFTTLKEKNPSIDQWTRWFHVNDDKQNFIPCSFTYHNSQVGHLVFCFPRDRLPTSLFLSVSGNCQGPSFCVKPHFHVSP